MAVTQTQYTGNGNTVLYSFTFPYLATTDVKVKINGVTQATTEYSLANATTVQMNSAPANGATVLIFRDTDNDNKKATFYPGSAIKAEDLNDNIDQILYVAQEVDNNAMSTLGDDAMQGDLSLGNNKITNLGNPSSGTDAVNKTTLDSTIDTAIESDVLVGTDLSKSASGGQVTINHNVSGANTTINNSGGNVVQDITISAQGHVTSAGSVNLDNRYYTETELNAGQLDNRYFTETELSGGQLNNLYYTETELDGGQLDNRYFTETELNNGALDNRYFTEAELNNGQLDTRYFRQDSSETITSGATWSANDNFIATTGAIDARIIDLVDDVGGFVPIANETSFPATNPDVNNGTGTLVSIKSIASARTPSGGSVVITNGAGSGNNVTITGLGTTVLPAGYGVIVETTGTTHTYTFHRLSPDATSVTAVSAIPNEIATVAGISSHVQTVSGINNDVQVVGANSSNVTTVAGSITNVNTAASNLDQIQNFANVYRIVSSDPTTSLNAGDLIFNTTTNKFKVYTGAAWVDAVARQFSDNTKMQFGNGNDLEIFHDGTHSHIIETGSGNLAIHTDNILQLAKNDTAGSYEVMGQFVADGAAELYYDGSKKLNTTSTGINIEGTGPRLDFTDTNHNNFAIIVDGNDLNIQDTTAGENRFNINSSGVVSCNDGLFVPDAKSIFLGNSNDLSLKHDGTDSRIINNGSELLIYTVGDHDVKILADSQNAVICKPDGAVELYFDNSKKLETTSDGVDVFNIVRCLGGTPRLQFFGDVNGVDTTTRGTFGLATGANQIVHGTTTNDVALNTPRKFFIGHASTEVMGVFDPDGSVDLYYDNDKKFETTNGGCRVTSSSSATLQVRSVGATDATLVLVTNDDDATDWSIRNDHSDSNELDFRFNNNQKMGLDSSGNLTITGNLDVGDNDKLLLGGGDDLQIYHSGSHSFIDDTGTGDMYIRGDNALKIQNAAGSEQKIVANSNGSVDIYYDGSKKFETTSSGATISGTLAVSENIFPQGYIKVLDNQPVYYGTGNDMSIFHDGSHSHVLHNGPGNLAIHSPAELQLAHNDNAGTYEHMVRCISNGAVELYYDGSKKLHTHSGGITISGSIHMDDNNKYIVGSSDDLQIFHDGANSYIQNSTGNLIFKNATANYIVNDNSTGAVELNYNGSKKLETTSGGVTVTGSVTTQDINMSNLNAISGNEVDGTKGNWTMQEGESDLFLINRISGKKYKFNLTEIN